MQSCKYPVNKKEITYGININTYVENNINIFHQK